jgi:hypothetical protein
MRILALTSFFLLFGAGSLLAQDEGARITAGEALDQETCQRLVNQLMPRIEAYTRMKYRRPVPTGVQPKVVWEARLKQSGFGGSTARSGLAMYNILANRIVVIPWVIGNYLGGNPSKDTRAGWLRKLEPILLHELTHAIHHQNYFVVLGGARSASLRTGGLTEEQIDVSTVEFLIAEGTAELVSLRVASPRTRAEMYRHPNRELPHARNYMRKYRPNGQDPYRVLLSRWGYQDGMDLMHHITLKAGPRGVRGVLYRQPKRALFFQPEILATVDLDDPPEPDSILGFLSPEILEGGEILLAVNPGENRFFRRAHEGRERADGCLIGFFARVGSDDSKHGSARYSFFVADPDNPGNWSNEQTASLKLLNPNGVKEYSKPLLMRKGRTAKFVQVKTEEGSVYLHAEADGLVVMAHESKPTDKLEERVLLALSALDIKRPTPNLYDAATTKAIAKLSATD